MGLLQTLPASVLQKQAELLMLENALAPLDKADLVLKIAAALHPQLAQERNTSVDRDDLRLHQILAWPDSDEEPPSLLKMKVETTSDDEPLLQRSSA